MITFDKNLSIDGIPIVRLENDYLQVDVAPVVGGRVVNILEKSSGHQFLWRNQKLKLERLEPGAEYDPNFYGGIDELIPNDIPETLNGLECPDHGELWTMALDSEIAGETLVLSGMLPIFGLRYERRMTLRPDSSYIDIDYRIQNPSEERREFLWKLHAALNIEPGDRIVCPASTAMAPDLDYSRWHSEKPFAWPEIEGQRADIIPERDGTMDFLYLFDLVKGQIAWESPGKGVTFVYEFDLDVMPYAWIFASFGGFEGHYTIILEPCTTMPISVTEAVRLGQCSVLEPGEAIDTRVSIYVGPLKE